MSYRGKYRNPLRDGLERAIGSLKPDLIVLTEYLTKPDVHEDFTEQLRTLGLRYSALSVEDCNENRVSIAAKTTMQENSPTEDWGVLSARSNYLSVHLPALGINLIGLRVPFYSGECTSEQRDYFRSAYGDWLQHSLAPFSDTPTIVIGDFNFDPGKDESTHAWIKSCFTQKLFAAVDRSDPNAKWFYCSPPGNERSFKSGSRLDHALISRSLAEPISSRYISKKDGFIFLADHRASDHAAFEFEIGINTALASGHDLNDAASAG